MTKRAFCEVSENVRIGSCEQRVLVPQGSAYYSVDIDKPPRKFAFLLIDKFTLLAFCGALEPLRIANQLAQRPLYRWSVYSEDGSSVVSSCGVEVNVEARLSMLPHDTQIIVCSGTVSRNLINEVTLAVLRRHSVFGGKIGAVCTGAIILARAGLLDGRRATLHWENQPAFREEFPELEVTENIFEIDLNTFTCGGGIAATDLMLEFIEKDFGQHFTEMIADMCLSGTRRTGSSLQRRSVSHHVGTRNPFLVAAIKLMQENFESPTTINELASNIGCSRRQIERLFLKYLHVTPYQYYRNLRLDHGRSLLHETDLGISEIALASGFSSTTSFAKAFRSRFGMSPGHTRKHI